MLVLSLLIGTLVTFPSSCSCAKASDTDRPHGANETVEIRGPVVKNLAGTVWYPDDKVAGDVVVEVYDLSKEHSDAPINEIIGSRSRRIACVTATDGGFSFSDLPSGKYLVRAGTRQAGGMNELYARVTVDRSWFRGLFRRSKPLQLKLSLGT
ncbi:MAG TPA: hypothetical protein VE961_21770 [Pyrinomonadaceae bacterium]|nr:hypothetical protein [Pyrinomonadaceae bacterium]